MGQLQTGGMVYSNKRAITGPLHLDENQARMCGENSSKVLVRPSIEITSQYINVKVIFVY